MYRFLAGFLTCLIIVSAFFVWCFRDLQCFKCLDSNTSKEELLSTINALAPSDGRRCLLVVRLAIRAKDTEFVISELHVREGLRIPRDPFRVLLWLTRSFMSTNDGDSYATKAIEVCREKGKRAIPVGLQVCGPFYLSDGGDRLAGFVLAKFGDHSFDLKKYSFAIECYREALSYFENSNLNRRSKIRIETENSLIDSLRMAGRASEISAEYGRLIALQDEVERKVPGREFDKTTVTSWLKDEEYPLVEHACLVVLDRPAESPWALTALGKAYVAEKKMPQAKIILTQFLTSYYKLKPACSMRPKFIPAEYQSLPAWQSSWDKHLLSSENTNWDESETLIQAHSALMELAQYYEAENDYNKAVMLVTEADKLANVIVAKTWVSDELKDISYKTGLELTRLEKLRQTVR